VVGIVGDVRQNSLTGEPRPTMYVSFRQVPAFAAFLVSSMTMGVRSQLEPASLVAGVRRKIAALDPTLPVASVRKLDDVAAAASGRQRFAAQALGVFAAIACGVTLLGIVSLVVQLVTRRRREVAIRMALGAGQREILTLVLAEGLRLAVVGVLLGLLAAGALERFLAHLLYGVGRAGWSSISLGTAALLLAAAAAACLAPAWLAAKTPPALSMRRE
jgi:ABC-type antimicrobial peptide transport system permease subunit